MADYNYGSRKGNTWTCGNCKTEYVPKKIGSGTVESEGFSLGFRYDVSRCPNCKQPVLDRGSQQDEIVNP